MCGIPMNIWWALLNYPITKPAFHPLISYSRVACCRRPLAQPAALRQMPICFTRGGEHQLPCFVSSAGPPAHPASRRCCLRLPAPACTAHACWPLLETHAQLAAGRHCGAPPPAATRARPAHKQKGNPKIPTKTR